MSANQFDGMMYQTIKRMGGLYNYGVEHRFELRDVTGFGNQAVYAERRRSRMASEYALYLLPAGTDAEKQYDKNIDE